MSEMGPFPGPGTVPRRADPERTARIVCVIVGALALLSVLGVGLLSSDKAGGTQVVLGGGGQPGAPTGGGGSSGAPANGGLSPAALKAHFPLPPGARPTRLDLTLGPGETAYDVRASLPAVKAYYESKLSALGVQWTDPSTTTDSDGTVVGWHGSLYLPDSPSFYGFLSLDENFLNNQPGVVTIQVTIQ